MKVCGFLSVMLKRGTSFLAASVAVSGLALASAFPCSAQTMVTVLYSFKGKPSSATPVGVTPAQGRDGSLFGNTAEGGSKGDGTAFRLATSGGYKLLYSFVNRIDDPEGGLTLGIDGNYYGTTIAGGTKELGTLYKISPGGTYSLLQEFQGGSNGQYPLAAPIQASDGSFYGTTNGTEVAPTVYRYKLDGTFSTIFVPTAVQGQLIRARLVQGTDGNLYGTAESSSNGCGTIFKLTLNGKLLFDYAFPGTPGGCIPVGALIQATDGNFYGVTYSGGSANLGTIFKLDQSGNVSILYSFQVASGDNPNYAGLAEGTDGDLYGTTSAGGYSGFGTLFSITTAGSYTVLADLTSETQQPFGALLQHTNGLFYGISSNGGQTGNGAVYSFDMGLAPFVTFVLPAARVGRTVQILGEGFTGTTSVTFNGVTAMSFTVGSDTFLSAVVPTGATTGPVVVTTPTGTLTSNKSFQVLP
jgi:uncharacterized repeat protein (TIGR03803 family)